MRALRSHAMKASRRGASTEQAVGGGLQPASAIADHHLFERGLITAKLVACLHSGKDVPTPRARTGRCRPRRRARRLLSAGRKCRRQPLRRRSRRRRRRAARPGRRRARPGSWPAGALFEHLPLRLSIVSSFRTPRSPRRRRDCSCGHDDDTVHAGCSDRSHHPAAVHVEDEQLAGVHMCDVEPARCRVQARVVKSVARPRQRHSRDLFQGERR